MDPAETFGFGPLYGGVSTYNIPRDIFSYNPPAQCDVVPEFSQKPAPNMYSSVPFWKDVKFAFQRESEEMADDHLTKLLREAKRIQAKKVNLPNRQDKADLLEFLLMRFNRFADALSAATTQDLTSAYFDAKKRAAEITFKEDLHKDENDHPGYTLRRVKWRFAELRDFQVSSTSKIEASSKQTKAVVQAWANKKLDKEYQDFENKGLCIFRRTMFVIACPGQKIDLSLFY